MDSAVNNLKQNLLITCGWNADSDPEIAPLPDVDTARLDSMNLAAAQNVYDTLHSGPA